MSGEAYKAAVAAKLKWLKMWLRVRIDLPPEETGWWLCRDCKKWLPDSAACNYDWSGTCSTGSYDFLRDHPLVISGRDVLNRRP